MSFDTRIDRLKRRLSRRERPVFILENDPEVRRRQWLGLLPPDVMTSDREALVGGAYHQAAPDEATGAFHERMLDIAREQNVHVISVGYPPYPQTQTGAQPVGAEAAPTKH